MLALCLMLLVTYYALNYAGIIGLGLKMHQLLQKQNIYAHRIYIAIITKATKFQPEQVDVLPSKNQALCVS